MQQVEQEQSAEEILSILSSEEDGITSSITSAIQEIT